MSEILPYSKTATDDNNSEPLVSIIVITYNSSAYVIETLESAKAQTYQNIELIISDDCSTDNTVNVCQQWLSDNKDRFINVNIVSTPKNSGVAPNCNNGLNAAKGEWVKLIAGDDLLVDEAIEKYIKFISINSSAKVVISDMQVFGEKNERYSINNEFSNLNAKQQLYYFLIFMEPSVGPSGFLNRSTLLKLGGYDEICPMIEDVPVSLRLLSNGVRTYLISDVCVKYRANTGSVSTAEGFLNKYWKMIDLVVIPQMKKNNFYFLIYHYWVIKTIRFNYSSGLLSFSLMRYLLKSTDIYSWIKFLGITNFWVKLCITK